MNWTPSSVAPSGSSSRSSTTEPAVRSSTVVPTSAALVARASADTVVLISPAMVLSTESVPTRVQPPGSPTRAASASPSDTACSAAAVSANSVMSISTSPGANGPDISSPPAMACWAIAAASGEATASVLDSV